MSCLRHFIQNEDGFSLPELLVAVALLAIVLGAVLTVQQQGQQAYLLGSSRVSTQQNARVALDLMTRELRTAASISDISSCSSGVCTDLTFVDQNDQTIEYQLVGTTLNRTCTATPTTTTCDGTTLALIGGVTSLGITSYSVYDVSTGTFTTTTTPAQVKVVKISVTAGPEQTVGSHSPGDQRATMESTVQLRLGLT
jgi:prepilin-type N-terminal cleavage/methylation domain-containing protein